MKTKETRRIRFQLGDLLGRGNYIGLLCDAEVYYNKTTHYWTLSGDGFVGSGTTIPRAAVDWIQERLCIKGA